MRKKLLLVVSCFLAVFYLHAQENIGGRPYSFDNVLMERVDAKALPKLDVAPLKALNVERKRTGQPLQSGEILPSNYSLDNSGTWSVLPNGDRIWRLKIDVPGALGTSLYYKNFKLPQGARLYVYNPEKNYLIGGFTSKNNQSHKLFASEIVYSPSCIVEYYEPASVKGQGAFTITGVTHVFVVPSFVKTTKIGESGSCNVNVNCPEGANWQNQKRAVARILLKEGSGQFLCTGTLLNNAAQNNKPYFLTADHCGGSASATDFSQWVFYFNYESPTCSTPSSVPSQTVTGAVQRARSGNKGDGDDSDFQLLEFTSAIPSTYNVFLAGWDATGTASPSGVGIHHPAGDIKKISTYTSPLTDDSGDHWRVFWVKTQTNWGITEGGSSGSPIFNNQGNVVGDLTGGASACGVPASDAWDSYGKVSYSWTPNGTTADRQLKPWLDPNNTGVKTLAGKNYNSGGNVNPTVSITSPANGATFSAGATITITANAADSDGSITSVAFYNGTSLLGTDASSPYSYTWTNVPAGTYTLTARATDNGGATTTSSLVTITVGGTPGLVDITNSTGTVSAQYTDSPAGEEIGKVIDNSSSTKYLTFHASGWIQYKAASSYVVTKYSTTSANDHDERDPLSWTFLGSTNGTTWVTLNTQSDQDFASRILRREFSFTNTTAYSYYRLQMSNNSETILQIAEWEIFGKPSSETRVDITNLGGTITSQYNDSPSGQEVSKATDNLATTKYTTYNGNAWIQFKSNSSYIVTKYSITSADNAQDADPMTWKLQASNNGTTWVTLNSQSGTVFTSRMQKKDFVFPNTTAYTYYRLTLFNSKVFYQQIAEWELWGVAASASGASRLEDEKIAKVEGVTIYPNPGNGIVNIKGISTDSKIQLIDRQGAVVRSWNNIDNSGIDMSNLKAGIYWIRATGKSGVHVKKFIVN